MNLIIQLFGLLSLLRAGLSHLTIYASSVLMVKIADQFIRVRGKKWCLMINKNERNHLLIPHPLRLNGPHADNHIRAERQGNRIHARLRRRVRMLMRDLIKRKDGIVE